MSRKNYIISSCRKKFYTWKKTGVLYGETRIALFANMSRVSRLAKRRLFTQGTPMDCGILTPRKTRFYSRPNKLKHKPLVRGSLSLWCAPSCPPIPVLPIRFLLHVFLPRYFTASTENDKNKVAAFTQAGYPYRDAAISRDADVVDVNLSPAVPFTMPRLRRENLFFLPPRAYITPEESAQLCFYLNILHSLQRSILKFRFASSSFFLFLDCNPISPYLSPVIFMNLWYVIMYIIEIYYANK